MGGSPGTQSDSVDETTYKMTVNVTMEKTYKKKRSTVSKKQSAGYEQEFK